MPHSSPRTDDPPRFGTGLILKGIIWLFCLGLIAVGWLVVIQQTRFEREQAVAEAVAQNQNRVIAFEQYVRRTLEVAAIATRYVADRFSRGLAGAEFVGTPDRPARMSGAMAREVRTFLGVAIINARGDVVATTRPSPQPLNVGSNAAFRTHISGDDGRLHISPPVRLPGLNRPVILLTRRLNNPDGSFAGVVALSILPEQFVAFYRDARIGSQEVISLNGLDGITRARRTGDVSSSGDDLNGRLVMRMQARDPNGTYIGPGSLDGLVRIYSHRRLSDYPLFASYGVLESEVLAPPRRRARILIIAVALGTLATLAFAMVLTLMVSRRDRRAREMALANRRLQEAQRIGQIGDWDYDLRTGVTYWSPQLCTQFERRPEQGSPTLDEFLAYLDDDGRETVARAHAAAIETGESQEIEYDVHLPSGAENRRQAWVIPTFDRAGNVVGLRGTDQTITGRQLLEQLQSRLAHLSRIEAMNAMAGTLAHELNQPLAAAANYLAGARRHLQTSPQDAAGMGEGLAAAEHQIHFAGDVIRQVREMVSNRQRSVSNFGLSLVIDDAVTVISAAGATNLSPVKRLDPDAQKVRADRVQVQQVIINLLRNALDATAEAAAPEIVVASRRDKDGMVLISISDNGPGFSRPEAERFSPAAASGGTGMGLGLSISRTIIESVGGRIWTEDREGGGAVVCLTLPAAASARAMPETAIA